MLLYKLNSLNNMSLSKSVKICLKDNLMKMKKKMRMILVSHFRTLRQLKAYILKKLRFNNLRQPSLTFQNPSLAADLDASKSNSKRRLAKSQSMLQNNLKWKIPEKLRSFTLRNNYRSNAVKALANSTNVKRIYFKNSLNKVML